MENKTATKKIIITLAIFFALLASFSAGAYLQSTNQISLATTTSTENGQAKSIFNKNNPRLTNNDNFNLFWEVWDTLKKDYVSKDKLNEQEMIYGAIRGLVSSTGDPYTVFMDPKETKSFDDDMAGTFEGIGAEIGIKKEQLVIIAPLPDSPAKKAGLRSGDRINKINNDITVGMTTDEAVRKIRGTKGTEVILNITHSGEEKSQEIKIIRDVIVIKSVRTELRKDGIMVITVTNFNNDTEALFDQAVTEVITKNPKGIILDLRNNPGGYLDTAIEMASKWVDEGTIVSEKFGDNKINEYKSRGVAKLKGYPTIVLVNQGSASASEIVAGALKDYGAAIVMGKQTFGKGSVQVLESLNDGSSIKVTIAQWLTPKGSNIAEKGIAPDKIVDMTAKDYEEGKDPQLEAAVKDLTIKK